MSKASERTPKLLVDEQFSPYVTSGSVVLRRFRSFIPAMLITNLSNMLLVTVNGLVVGNFVSSSGFACVSIIEPVEALINTISTLAACSIATSLSQAIGRGDSAEFDKVKEASFKLMTIIALLSIVIELPIAWFVIRSYNLDPVMYGMTWKYAMIRILSSPVEIVVTVCVYDLQIAGKMRAVMHHAVLQGVSNLLFDLLFVAGLHMGIAGAGYGTACALLLRAILSHRYITTYTDLFKCGKHSVTISDFCKILPYGIPDAAYELMDAVRDYFIIKILLLAFGADGGIISGVCNFCLALGAVFIRSVRNSARPMTGLLAGADDRRELGILMLDAVIADLILVGPIVILAELIPSAFYRLYGVTDIPGGGLMSLRIFAPFMLIYACNTLFRMYLSNRNDSKRATIATVVGTATLPVFAYIFVLKLGSPFLWLAYSAAELLTLLFYLGSLRRLRCADQKKEMATHSLYVSFDPEHASYVSDEVMEYLTNSGVESRLSYRIALCMEEIGAYAQTAEKRNNTVKIYFRAKITNDNEALLVILDDGKCIYFNQDEEYIKLITDNYALIKRIAKSTEYQYILNMNYIMINL